MKEKWMDLAKKVQEQSSCVRRHVGAVIVRDDQLLSYGFNHTPNNIPQCTEETCIRKINNIKSGTRHEMCLAVHAEQNALIMALKKGINVEGATIYVTDSPCIICTKLLINAGIKTVYYDNNYPDELSLQLLNQAGVDIIKYNAKEQVKTKIKER